jgi:hypothetical protein
MRLTGRSTPRSRTCRRLQLFQIVHKLVEFGHPREIKDRTDALVAHHNGLERKGNDVYQRLRIRVPNRDLGSAITGCYVAHTMREVVPVDHLIGNLMQPPGVGSTVVQCGALQLLLGK